MDKLIDKIKSLEFLNKLTDDYYLLYEEFDT